MSVDERRLELQDRVRANRTNAGIARNTAFDLAQRLEQDLLTIRRKLEHDELEELADGRAIGYSSFFTSDPFNLERNLVRIIHFIGEMKVAQHDLEELDKEVALTMTAHGVGRRTEVGTIAAIRKSVEAPYIEHGFIPKVGAWRYCDNTYQGKDNDEATCGNAIEFHKVLDPAYMRCGLTKVAHSTHPSPVDGESNPHGHDFYNVTEVGDGEWFTCNYPVKVEDRKPDPHSHLFQGGNGSSCTYSSYGVECGEIRKAHRQR